MNQALHIFKKDVRYLRWELAASLLLMGMFVYMNLRRVFFRDLDASIFSYFFLAFWAFLSARLIQAEPVPGDRQFWITRPYEWRSLLGAKLLFMVVCIGIPLLIADAVILGVDGFSVTSHAVALVWSVMLMTAGILIAFCAFATLTRGLTQWFLSAIVTVAVLYVMATIANEKIWAGVEWAREYGYLAILFAAAVVVLLRQYRRHKTAASIAVMAVGLLGSSLFVNYARSSWALDFEARFSKPKVDPSPIQIAVQPMPHSEQSRPPGRQQQVVLLAIPIRISGLQEGLDLISDEVRIDIENEGGGIWTQNTRQPSGANYLQHILDGYRLLLQVDRSAFDKANGRPVDLGMTVYLTTLRDSVSKVLRPGAAPVTIPGVGRCQNVIEEPGGWIVCESALQTPPDVLVVEFGGERLRRDRFLRATSYSPFPADAGSAIVPVIRTSHSWSRDFAAATLTSLEPVAHFRRDLKLSSIHLEDYQVVTR